MAKTEALGKGLNALLPGGDEGGMSNGGEFFVCDIEEISPNPFQPRKEMKSKELDQLSRSIREKGVLQPLVVRHKDNGDGYEIIAGERRWRAAQLAGLEKVPVLLKEDVEEIDRLELAIIENIQRQNLNPLEEAEAYNRLIKEFGLTQEKVAKQVGKERSTVANILRILHLPDFVKHDIANGTLSLGHARVLLSLDDVTEIKEVRDIVVHEGLTVRQTEALIKKKKKKGAPRGKKISAAPDIPESYCKALTNDLVRFLGTKCKIVQQGVRGKVEIEYYSLEDLERLLELIVKRK